jgi:hypothetical protein
MGHGMFFKHFCLLFETVICTGDSDGYPIAHIECVFNYHLVIYLVLVSFVSG